MFRPILAAFLALALCMPLATGPAHADKRDVVKIISGLAAIYLLKEAIDRNRERDNDRAAVARARPPAAALSPARSPRPSRSPQMPDALALPERCHVTYRTDQGIVAGYGARCMQNAVARPGLLPPQCLVPLATDQGSRNVYSPRCLRSEGWTSRTAAQR